MTEQLQQNLHERADFFHEGFVLRNGAGLQEVI